MTITNFVIFMTSFVIVSASCNFYSNCIDATDLLNVTNTSIITPIIGYVYSADLKCWNTTCNLTEYFIPLID